LVAISVWCETFRANFGEVVIPATLSSALNTTINGPKQLCTTTAEVSLGTLRTRGHRVSGQVVALSESVLEIRNLVYDGFAPDVFFWADVNSIPSIGGFVLNDAAPTNSCGSRPLPAANGAVTYRVEFPNGKSIRDILGGSISIWCRSFKENFGEVRC
jgi:Electron transfer DM13